MASSKTVIFDFDGTIADTFAVAMSVFHQVTGNKHDLSEAEIEALHGLPAAEVIKHLGIPLWRVPFLVTKGRKLMRTRIDELHPFSGLPEVIRQLHKQGNKLAIVSSNSSDNIGKFLEKHNMANAFESVYGGIGLFSKARFMRKMLQSQEIEPSGCVYVGDEARDIHAARRVGVPVVAVSWGYNTHQALAAARPDAVADKPRELLKILENL